MLCRAEWPTQHSLQQIGFIHRCTVITTGCFVIEKTCGTVDAEQDRQQISIVEVGDGTRANGAAGLVSLSDRYLRHGSEADRRRLVRRGLVIPAEAVGRVQ